MRYLLVTSLLLMLAACQPAPMGYTLAPVSFSQQQKIAINVARINVIKNYDSPLRAPHVEHQMSMPPAKAVEIWAAERLQAVGSQGQLDVIIDDASIRETKLPVKQGIKGFFTDDQSERYDASLKVTLRLYDGINTISRASGDVAVSRARSINEKSTLADREKLWHDMSTDMARALDREAEQRLRQYFLPYLR